MVKFLTSTIYLSSEGNFISSFVGCPRIFSYPQTGYWAWSFLTLFLHMRLDIGPGLLRCNLNTRYNWPPQYILSNHERTSNANPVHAWYMPYACIGGVCLLIHACMHGAYGAKRYVYGGPQNFEKILIIY